MERSSNPALRDEIFYRSLLNGTEDLMTVQGTINKTLVLLCIVLVTAALVWNSYSIVFPIIIPAMIGGLIVALVTIFRQQWSPYTAPVYALFEGIILGGISGYMDALYPGIVVQAVALTFGVFFLLLIVFSTRLIQVTEKFRLVVIAATGAIALLYIADIVLGFFGRPVGFVHESGIFGIGFSLVVIVIASLNLILDFDYIEKGVEHGAPRYLEWYGAFALLVTLVWLYLEILRLLGKMRR
ncbi:MULTISPECIES: Bax inhibitor-1/YccA family protein [unclassified Methanoregula]|uniref:Bax inhibitor-1/YccA family protein n=1 Tax=unclassified Methanoregula TaxID=2649730 RepID=UPI0009C9E285|nr:MULTISPECIES: Bax inhibitor-1/YccA family protein [unclassified Methanoregula]OPX63329.1 MAG: Bax inhibitor 1 like protein [Methanoregula sp. PtaB.Bin085]OPY35067.1 MAG: Bax inhibitor 1 like protein [Methanoregula sp. PtaU1.Bin006]